MNSTDVELLRALRREFGKRPIDVTRLDIQVSQGRVIVAGQIANLRDQPLINLHDEFAIVEKIFSRHPLCKSFTTQVRLIQADVKDEHDDPRGRLRHH